MSSCPHEDSNPPATTLDDAIGQLGEPIGFFKPGMENLVAGIIIGLLMVLGGATVMTFAIWHAVAKGGHWLEVCVMAAGGLALAGLGVYFILAVRSMFSLRVLVCPAGFLCVERSELQVFPWHEIERVQETVTQEYFPLKGVAKNAVPMGTSRSFVVRRHDGVEFAFNGNTVKKLNTLARMIEEATSQRAIPWYIVHE